MGSSGKAVVRVWLRNRWIASLSLRPTFSIVLPVLAAEPVEIATGMRLLDGTGLEFIARVPTVEMATVIKAYAYASRKFDRDVEDIHRLLEIVDTYPAETIGGWRLDQPDPRGSRRDAAVRLHELGRQTRRLTKAEIPAARLATLIAAHVRSLES